MKYIGSLLIMLASLALTQPLHAQCNAEEYIASSTSNLPAGFNFLKSYKIDGEPDLEKIEFSYVLTKGTQYMLVIRDRNKSLGTVMTLFDAKRNKVASNRIDGSMAAAIAFPCNATGIYYIQYTFETGSNRCAGSALGFKR
jgi:hypothetical protein